MGFSRIAAAILAEPDAQPRRRRLAPALLNCGLDQRTHGTTMSDLKQTVHSLHEELAQAPATRPGRSCAARVGARRHPPRCSRRTPTTAPGGEHGDALEGAAVRLEAGPPGTRRRDPLGDRRAGEGRHLTRPSVDPTSHSLTSSPHDERSSASRSTKPSARPSISATRSPTTTTRPTCGTSPTACWPAPCSTGSTRGSLAAIRAARSACRSAPPKAASPSCGG